MGCSESKLEEIQVVALCRHRSHHLAEAVRHRHSLASSHSAYLHSLHSLGLSLHRFFLPPDSDSPLLPLPSFRKICDNDYSDDELLSCQSYLFNGKDDEGEFLYLNGSGGGDDFDEPLHADRFQRHSSLGTVATSSSTTTHFSFAARKGPPAVASVAYEPQPEVFPDQFGVFDGRGDDYFSYPDYYHYHRVFGNVSSNYAYPYQYPPAYGMMGGGGSSSLRFAMPSTSPYSSRRFTPSPSSSLRFATVPSPPPPPAPSVLTWDFLNPFESSYQGYNRVYTPSWSSMEVREREGIPDLEDAKEEEQEEERVIVKEMYGGDPVGVSPLLSASVVERLSSGGRSARLNSVGGNMDYRMHDRCVVDDGDDDEIHLQEYDEQPPRKKVVPGSRSVSEAVQEIKTQFDRASMSCKEVSKLLGSKMLQYQHRKHEAVLPSRMMYGNTPTLSKATSSHISISRSEEQSDCSSSGYLEFDEDGRTRAGNLSLTLQKLCVWEKKLHQEVRAEEKMRVLHDKKCKLLKHLDEKGAEGRKVDAARALIKKLSTKIRIAIQFIDSISHKLNKLRDEELWPQINELIHGLARMWRSMTECHRNQCQAIIEAKNLDSVVSAYTGRLSDAHMGATIQLVQEMLDWIEAFCSWIETQRSYVRALNSWLQKCLVYKPEETADGKALSPGKLGAPPIFVICNYWSQLIDRISEKEVVEAMQAFGTSVLQVWQQHYYERRQMMLANRDMERMLKVLEREDQRIHKALRAVNKRHAQVSNGRDLLTTGEIIRLSHATETNNPNLGLRHICEAMEKFTDRSMKGYEKLCIRCDELSPTMEHANIS